MAITRLRGQNALTIKTGVASGGGSLAGLNDVITIDQSNNATLVFNAELGRYEIKPLPSITDSTTIEELDGGNF